MKNPFEKDNKFGLIAAIVIGGATVAALAYLFLTEDGEELLAGWTQQIKELAKDQIADVVSDKTGISKKTAEKAANVATK